MSYTSSSLKQNRVLADINKDFGILTSDGWVFEGDCSFIGLILPKLPKIYKVGGSFYCYNTTINSLDGCPQFVGGDFVCFGNVYVKFTKKYIKTLCKVKGRIII